VNIAVTLSAHEVRVIENALEIWESEPGNKALFASMTQMLTIRDPIEQQRKTDAEFAKADAEKASRKRQSVLLRAKLMQAEATASEHAV
jgi:hypothetical protein